MHGPRVTLPGIEAALEGHLRLEDAFDQSLRSIVADTESASLSIIERVRTLHDAAQKLVTYLDGTSIEAGNLGKEITDSMQYLAEIGAFIHHLPERMKRELDGVQAIVREIKDLSGLTQSVQAISMQSHLLAINASIEASHAGQAGTAFRVVADEMRLLASNSNAVAAKINQGLARCRGAIEGGMAASIADSSNRLAEVSNADVAIRKLRDNLEDMSQYYKTRFAIVTKHNEDLATNIAEVLGHIQTQDVVRQCVERMQAAVARRDAVLRDAVDTGAGADSMDRLSREFESILEAFLAVERHHQRGQEDDGDGDGTAGGEGEPRGRRIELF